jgi:hypothetical protein
MNNDVIQVLQNVQQAGAQYLHDSLLETQALRKQLAELSQKNAAPGYQYPEDALWSTVDNLVAAGVCTSQEKEAAAELIRTDPVFVLSSFNKLAEELSKIKRRVIPDGGVSRNHKVAESAGQKDKTAFAAELRSDLDQLRLMTQS